MSDDIAYWLMRLGSSEPKARVRALQGLAAQPVADDRLLAAAEKLLDDREVCLVQIPYRFGEVRFFAADAVGAIRQAMGNPEPVVLTDTFYPLSGDDVSRYAEAAGVARQLGMDGVLATLRELLARSGVKLHRITRP